MSQAMVMCSTNEDRSKFEVLDPPAGCVPGDRVTFEGFPGEPDKQLNPKKKVNTTTVDSRLADTITPIILLHQKFLQFDWLRAVVFQLNLKYLHVKITNLLWVV